MRACRAYVLSIAIAAALTSAAHAQNAVELLEQTWTSTPPLYCTDAAFERVLVDAAHVDEIMTLDDARTHPSVLAVYRLTGEETNSAWRSVATAIAPPDSFVVPESVATIAEGYRPEPRAIVQGYLAGATATAENGVVTYTSTGNGGTPAFTLRVSNGDGRVLGTAIGDGETTALEANYDYNSAGNVARVVFEFTTNEHPEWRWALIDFPVASDEATEAETAANVVAPGLLVPLNRIAPDPQPTNPNKRITNTPVEFVSSSDLIDPINLGNLSCDAEDGLCFDFAIVDICFNIGLGVGLNTNTTVEMDGNAVVEYPVAGRPGEALVSFAGTTGSSSIEYSFAYNAEICASATVPVLGTCEVSYVLAQNSVTAASGEQAFSPFLLPGDAERPVCTGDAIDPLLVGVNPGFSICELELSFTGGVNIDPNLDYCVSGDSMVVTHHGPEDVTARGAKTVTVAEIFTEGDEAWIPAFEGINSFDVDWHGEVSLAGSIGLAPVLSVTIPGVGEISLPLPGVTLPLGSLGITDLMMSDSFETELCSVAPRTPFRLWASRAASPNVVQVDWQSVGPAATGYRVFRALNEDLSDAVDISGVTTETWFTDTTATLGMGGCKGAMIPIEYYYYVVAVNACGESAPSRAVVGYVAEPKTLASLSPSGLGDLGTFAVAGLVLVLMRRRRLHRAR